MSKLRSKAKKELVRQGAGRRNLLRQGLSMFIVLKGKGAQHGEPFNVIREKSGKQGVLRGEAEKFLKGMCIQLRGAWISLQFTLGVLCTTDISRRPDRG